MILDPNQKITETNKGQTLFLAPEICENKPYDIKADCWAFGIILYCLLGSTLPLQGRKCSEKQLRRLIVSEKFDSEPLILRQTSSSAIDLVQRLLHKEPTKRLTISAALRHQWFKNGHLQ